eukprot:CAMPEP_0113884284 /NCGR_PEP_ID=MMETSP0780_2-20120614/10166_1 /TAXON_ID=652834 /ORGANISM="Palpitomonas bilix" /LENGTH=587 /DNA_ID=CAMNT_0000871875 /DNA_START=117 /DNA_END=1880 /DNA_ORIENTATION=+ /assembly_acc=CAM_ASM_000599
MTAGDKAVVKQLAGLFCVMLAAVIIVVVIASTSASPPVGGGGNVTDAVVTDILRPRFHVMPARNWMNDPNGPFVYNGMYHLFFQYNPSAAVWGNMHWYHVVSPNLVKWKRLPIALYPDMPYDKDGVFSGSAVVVDGIPYLYYTGVSSFLGPKSLTEHQCLAVPKNTSDPYLIEWEKPEGNPFVSSPPPLTSTSLWRDPSTPWKEVEGGREVWRFALGAAREEGGEGGASGEGVIGAVLIYVLQPKQGVAPTTTCSPTLSQLQQECEWVFERYLFEGDFGGGMWECPDIFSYASSGQAEEMPSNSAAYTVVKMSSQGGGWRDWYSVGEYNTTTFLPSSPSSPFLPIDVGCVYASKSFFDAEKGRRLWFGWIHGEESDTLAAKRGWQGVMSLPRQLSISEVGGVTLLLQQPVEEVAQLWTGQEEEVNVTTASQGTSAKVFSMCTRQAQIVAEMAGISSPSSLTLSILSSADSARHTSISVFVDTANNKAELVVDRQYSGGGEGPTGVTSYPLLVREGEEAAAMGRMEVYVDHSVVEVFAGDGRLVHTFRVYNSNEGDCHLSLSASAADGVSVVNGWGRVREFGGAFDDE